MVERLPEDHGYDGPDVLVCQGSVHLPHHVRDAVRLSRGVRLISLGVQYI